MPRELLEPEALIDVQPARDPGHFDAVSLRSAAISLKRIADVLERGAQFDVHGQFHDITNLAWEAGRSFKQGAGG